MKRLVVCCDGTWSTPDQTDAQGRPCATNVTKFALAVADADSAGVRQRVYYQRGVGTGRWDHISGGAFGIGLSANIKAAYSYLVESYDRDDELYFVGFSRGAYTARSLAGFVRNCGILRKEHLDRVGDAYELYRRRDLASHPRGAEARLFRRTYSYEEAGFETRIKFLGVWDTVGSLGIPVGPLALLSRKLLHLTFHDVDLSTRVDNAFQALAIDERRESFKPAIWEQQPDAKGQRLEQVWCVGAHGNVGGGASDAGLSDIALTWMFERAARSGLAVDPARLTDPTHGDPLAPISHTSAGLWGLLPKWKRPVRGYGALPSLEFIHRSVVKRIERDPSYRPENLDRDRMVEAPA